MDAPEKIWCKPNSESWGLYGHWYRDSAGGGTEYTRTDRANELVAAAYEDASDEVAMEWANEDMPCEGVGEHLRQTILNLTPADAVAALAARDARIREAALREAYVNLKTYRPHEVDGPEHDVGYTAGYVTAMNRIEALIAKDKANG